MNEIKEFIKTLCAKPIQVKHRLVLIVASGIYGQCKDRSFYATLKNYEKLSIHQNVPYLWHFNEELVSE